MNKISQVDASELRRFSWPEMRGYWEGHSKAWSDIDFVRDPDGLGNVCHPGEPRWVNAYYSRFQRKIYGWLLCGAPPPASKSLALDVGCGAGRWCRILASRGYQTVGIDLQPELVEQDRRRFPHIEFVRSAIQDFNSETPFDLISSVTVLQHLPFEEQGVAVRKMRALIREGGFVIALENIADQGQHVFANSILTWQRLFSSAAFKLVAVRRYDYSPFTRGIAALRRLKRIADGRTTAVDSGNAPAHGKAHRIRDMVTWLGVKLDLPIEEVLVRCNVDIPTVHCGFLFEAT